MKPLTGESESTLDHLHFMNVGVEMKQLAGTQSRLTSMLTDFHYTEGVKRLYERG